MQYCIQRRYVLVDEEDDLFVPFHLLICTAISSILESYEEQCNPFTLHNIELLIWMKCNFSGLESWNEVRKALQPYVSKIN
jgi:hypothetical protein